MIAHFNYNRSNIDNKNRTEYLLVTFKRNTVNWYLGLDETTKNIWKDNIDVTPQPLVDRDATYFTYINRWFSNKCTYLSGSLNLNKHSF